jgi:hypothetical protein
MQGAPHWCCTWHGPNQEVHGSYGKSAAVQIGVVGRCGYRDSRRHTVVTVRPFGGQHAPGSQHHHIFGAYSTFGIPDYSSSKNGDNM